MEQKCIGCVIHSVLSERIFGKICIDQETRFPSDGFLPWVLTSERRSNANVEGSIYMGCMGMKRIRKSVIVVATRWATSQYTRPIEMQVRFLVV